ncbi:MAG TPA: putative lipid II flippase FtsW [Acidimicrobiales bacterium]|nr:putative lipid II flippase FtsW [Acidimicrobiales bacterium]
MLTAGTQSGETTSVSPANPRRPGHLARSGKAGGTFWVLVFLTAILCLIGVVMVLSASSIISLQQFGSPWHFFARQVVWLAVGSLAFLLALSVEHERWRAPARVVMYITVALLFAVLVPGVGVSSGGASRWIGASSIQLQPSELAKMALILFAADVLDRRAGRDWKYRSAPVLAIVGLLIVLVMAQPDMGTTMVLVCIAAAMLFTAGMPLKPMAGLAGAGIVVGYLLAKAAPYRWRRITAFLNPFKNASNAGYQEVQALLAQAHGHILGDGLGSSVASYGFLPNAQTDFIFAIIGEETGLVGGVLLSGLFLTLGLVGTRVACRAPSRYAALVASGITAWLVSQAVINIGAVVDLLPVTGVPLPFVSFGGSSLVIALFATGMLANIARKS